MKNKRFDYFKYFISVAENINQSAYYLEKVFNSFNIKNSNDYIETIHKIKNSADLKQKELYKQLSREFMPPIDRYDIFILSQEFKSIISLTENVFNNLYMFSISSIRTEVTSLSHILSQITEIYIDITKEFKNFKKSKKIKDYILRINTLQNNSNKIYVAAVNNIFKSNLDDKDKLVWTIILKSLLDVINRCNSVANVIEGIIIKNT